MDNYQKQFRGRISKSRGRMFEEIIDSACTFYELKGEAAISKSNEPMRPLSKPNNKGQFLACFTKKSGPDYIGVRAGGRFIAMEAKHTDNDRLQQSAVDSEQEKRLNQYTALGADCFVMVSFGFREFFKVPWETFRAMKERYGRKYITPEDVREYAVKYIGGVLRFL